MSSRRAFLRTASMLTATGLISASSGRKAWCKSTASPLEWKSIKSIGDGIRRGEFTSVQVTNHILSRIQAFDTELHSYITLMTDEATAMAKASDERISNGRSRGPLEGVPIAVKDLFFTEGIKTTNATSVMADFVPTFDATAVTKLKAAGAVLIGKLNQTEGAMCGYNSKFQYPRNPWNYSVWPGVSSSGSGVATAAGLAYATLGTDTGGSIRYPAAACGVVGLKPTWGRVSRYGVFPLAESLDHVGPIARSTEDCALVLEAIAGPDEMDPTSLPKPMRKISSSLDQGVMGLRIGWDEDFVSRNADSEVMDALSNAVETFKHIGADVHTIEMPELNGYQKTWNTICQAEAFVAHSKFFPSRRNDYGPWFRQWLDLGSEVSGAEYASALHKRNECSGKISRVFRNIDVLILPGLGSAPFPISDDAQYGAIPDSWFEGDYSAIVGVFNFSGSPSLTLPCGFSKTELPLGMQLVGQLNREDLICRAGHAFEKATNFHLKHPNLL